jgi:serine/threonine protein kinase
MAFCSVLFSQFFCSFVDFVERPTCFAAAPQGDSRVLPPFRKIPKAVEVRDLSSCLALNYSFLHNVLFPMFFSICLLEWVTNSNLLSQRANILKEVQIMRQLDHPNIVKLVDFSESRQFYYIILELCPGGELFHQIVKLTYFSEDLSRHVIRQVAEAIEYLHETSGVVHRYVSNRISSLTVDS